MELVTKETCIKPILKWVGGKTQIIDKIIPKFPTIMNNYREIFLGGASVLLSLRIARNQGKITILGKIYAYDLNEPLIYVYKNIQDNKDELYQQIQLIINHFNECGAGNINRKAVALEEAKTSKENYYYYLRSNYNNLSQIEKQSLIGSALFIVLNKTCFRGLFRVSKNGFNVPYGNYNNPEIINQKHLDSIHLLIKDVIFECADFTTSLERVEEGDFVYLDPPYAPENIKSFVAYTEGGFNDNIHQTLFDLIHKLNINMMMSNADVKLVRDNFTDKKYNINEILCRRSINSTKPNSKAKEVIITNY